jgi:hypothetical protein
VVTLLHSPLLLLAVVLVDVTVVTPPPVPVAVVLVVVVVVVVPAGEPPPMLDVLDESVPLVVVGEPVVVVGEPVVVVGEPVVVVGPTPVLPPVPPELHPTPMLLNPPRQPRSAPAISNCLFIEKSLRNFLAARNLEDFVRGVAPLLAGAMLSWARSPTTNDALRIPPAAFTSPSPRCH